MGRSRVIGRRVTEGSTVTGGVKGHGRVKGHRRDQRSQETSSGHNFATDSGRELKFGGEEGGVKGHGRGQRSPLDGVLLLLHHVRQLLEDGAQLHDGGLNVLHGVRAALDVRILIGRGFVN